MMLLVRVVVVQAALVARGAGTATSRRGRGRAAALAALKIMARSAFSPLLPVSPHLWCPPVPERVVVSTVTGLMYW